MVFSRRASSQGGVDKVTLAPRLWRWSNKRAALWRSFLTWGWKLERLRRSRTSCSNPTSIKRDESRTMYSPRFSDWTSLRINGVSILLAANELASGKWRNPEVEQGGVGADRRRLFGWGEGRGSPPCCLTNFGPWINELGPELKAGIGGGCEGGRQSGLLPPIP